MRETSKACQMDPSGGRDGRKDGRSEQNDHLAETIYLKTNAFHFNRLRLLLKYDRLPSLNIIQELIQGSYACLGVSLCVCVCIRVYVRVHANVEMIYICKKLIVLFIRHVVASHKLMFYYIRSNNFHMPGRLNGMPGWLAGRLASQMTFDYSRTHV